MERAGASRRTKIFTAAAALSLLMLAFTAVVWVRSHQVMPVFSVDVMNRYVIDIDAPTDGICFFFEDDGHPGSPAYPMLSWPRAIHVAPIVDSVPYPPIGFRPDRAAYAMWMRYYPFMQGHAPRGRFSRFTLRSVLPDNIHEANFGWGVVIPMWCVMLVWVVLPTIWTWRRLARRTRTLPGGFPVATAGPPTDDLAALSS